MTGPIRRATTGNNVEESGRGDQYLFKVYKYNKSRRIAQIIKKFSRKWVWKSFNGRVAQLGKYR